MKKHLLVLLGGVLMSMSLVGCGGAEDATSDSSTAGPLELIVAHNQTSLENPYAYGMNKFEEVLEDISGGQIQVTVHHGTLGENESELIEKLQMGAVDMVNVSPGFMTAIGVPEVDMFSLLYLFDSFDHWETALDGEFGDAMKTMIKEKTGNNFQVMDYWSSSVRDVYAKSPIYKPADLDDLSIRTQSSKVQQDLFSATGAVPASVAWGELYQALQQGVVDGAENDYTNLMLKEHHKTDNGKFISETHHDYTTRLLLMSGAEFDKLTPEQQAWITEAVAAATLEERTKTYEMLEESKAKVIADGATVVPFEEIDIDAFKALAIPIQDQFAADNNMVEYLEMIRSSANPQ
ncbi:C4-dicarboxylate ABC transporter substrate-binding protein [Candidatus Epulonipiscium fishelsonii]|uniref:C4-dicarboxylate ABC transporter substrate-binding protein n=1 Tax=Candidatus Epulonipiscium fishelsonii TaxID=77094 RepID=A0ACC8X7U5_9FIRM|nr:C4-dicarboxylate ABC transporter substrate-binding protein [Epulopiscium sp. SCG-B11WGA-EpuloA1]ONI40722.1 C4-dicarboxylate ABC transporter substrate-binding protein [Epulopiscium sp. SCG-B05WGA-EpuloA1]